MICIYFLISSHTAVLLRFEWSVYLNQILVWSISFQKMLLLFKKNPTLEKMVSLKYLRLRVS